MRTRRRESSALWQQDVDAVLVRDRGLLGAPDHELWKLAVAETRTIVTINAKDFRKLAQRSQAHPGDRRHPQRRLSRCPVQFHHVGREVGIRQLDGRILEQIFGSRRERRDCRR